MRRKTSAEIESDTPAADQEVGARKSLKGKQVPREVEDKRGADECGPMDMISGEERHAGTSGLVSNFMGVDERYW